MAIIQSGASADTLTVDATSKAGRVTLYKTDGTLVEHEFVGEYYLSVNIPQFTAALAANACVFAIRNSTVKRMKFLRAEIHLSFAGTAAATTMQVSMRRFTVATPSGGTTLTTLIVPEDTTMPASAALYAGCATAAAALTTTGATVAAPSFVAQCPRSVTGGVFNYEIDRDLVLNTNEGLLIQYDTVGVIGDAIGITTYWGEYV